MEHFPTWKWIVFVEYNRVGTTFSFLNPIVMDPPPLKSRLATCLSNVFVLVPFLQVFLPHHRGSGSGISPSRPPFTNNL